MRPFILWKNTCYPAEISCRGPINLLLCTSIRAPHCKRLSFCVAILLVKRRVACKLYQRVLSMTKMSFVWIIAIVECRNERVVMRKRTSVLVLKFMSRTSKRVTWTTSYCSLFIYNSIVNMNFLVVWANLLHVVTLAIDLQNRNNLVYSNRVKYQNARGVWLYKDMVSMELHTWIHECIGLLLMSWCSSQVVMSVKLLNFLNCSVLFNDVFMWRHM
jgi:hypothetical protein